MGKRSCMEMKPNNQNANEKVEVIPEHEQPKLFKDLELCESTLNGLSKANYIEMTEIQAKSLPLTLQGKDVLGAAKTGSGKTLAFIIPILERLFQLNWNQYDGLGALVISPTRELALQIFEVLRKVGRYHAFSAGLLIGGKNLIQEQERVTRMNILIATPGRLLQHMDVTPDFNCDNLQVLVLDEADRIMDSGFQKTVNAIIENLPCDRQTLLFSATLPKSVKDLARLSLRDPEYISVHAKLSASTPENLIQKYLVCELDQKLDILFSFIKTHLKSKIIVFLSSCKQVRFVHDTFCKMQPGIQLMCLHGKQKQTKRLSIFDEFCRKKAACMFATDIAARGLDFPAVDWVVQVDCPEDAETYIHRVGRTARYESRGNALLFLLPSEEEGMLSLLNGKKVPLTKTSVNPKKLTFSIPKLLQSYCFADPEIKYLGQCALKSYLKSIFLGNKKVFNINKLNILAFAESLGLPGVPKLKFLSKSGILKKDLMKEEIKETQRKKNISGVVDNAAKDKDNCPQYLLGDEVNSSVRSKDQVITKIDRMFKRKNMGVFSEHYQKMIQHDDEESENGTSKTSDGLSDINEESFQEDINLLKESFNDHVDCQDDFMILKRKNHELNEEKLSTLHHQHSNSTIKTTKKEIQKLKKKEIESRGSAKKIIFDDEGNAIESFKLESLEEYADRMKKNLDNFEIKEYNAKNTLAVAALKHAEEARKEMAIIDLEDKQIEKQKRREKKLEKRRKEREMIYGMENKNYQMYSEDLYEEQDTEKNYLSSVSDEPYADEAIPNLPQKDWVTQQQSRKRSLSKFQNELHSEKKAKLDELNANDLENLALSLLN